MAWLSTPPSAYPRGGCSPCTTSLARTGARPRRGPLHAWADPVLVPVPFVRDQAVARRRSAVLPAPGNAIQTGTPAAAACLRWNRWDQQQGRMGLQLLQCLGLRGRRSRTTDGGRVGGPGPWRPPSGTTENRNRGRGPLPADRRPLENMKLVVEHGYLRRMYTFGTRAATAAVPDHPYVRGRRRALPAQGQHRLGSGVTAGKWQASQDPDGPIRSRSSVGTAAAASVN